ALESLFTKDYRVNGHKITSSERVSLVLFLQFRLLSTYTNQVEEFTSFMSCSLYIFKSLVSDTARILIRQFSEARDLSRYQELIDPAVHKGIVQ
ncbi:MAG: hypothetical protein XE05_2017, partial [Thermotogales bacterium 46_20]